MHGEDLKSWITFDFSCCILIPEMVKFLVALTGLCYRLSIIQIGTCNKQSQLKLHYGAVAISSLY